MTNFFLNGMGIGEKTYELIEGLPKPEVLGEIIRVYEELFSDADQDFFIKRLKTHENSLSILALDQGRLIGFKIGYPVLNDTFYSWIGGVLPEYRKKGVANTLAQLQENWAIEKGLKRLKTKSMNQYKPMIMLNLKRGFDITKVYTNEKGQTKIVFYKSLDQNNLS